MFKDLIIKDTELLIIGGGLAGLSSALEASREKVKTTVVYRSAGASPGVVGFNVPLFEKDSKNIFFQDIMESGGYINNTKLVNILIDESIDAMEMLESIGISFDKSEDKYDLLQPLSCSFPRLVHYQNYTGILAIKLITKLLKQRNVKIQRGIVATNLLTDKDKVVGALGFDITNNKFIIFKANAVILATGGLGAIYPFTTYFFDSFGSGYAMAFESGAELIDMEFVQFDPCCAVSPSSLRGRGVVTTILNQGAVIYNILGERFMLKLGSQGESVHKDILARGIYKEIIEGRGTENGGVYFDMSGVPSNLIEKNYPYLLKRYLTAGIDIRNTAVEVAPAAHTALGGIKIDENCRSSIEGLYACGEVAGGVHGANRIGGNAGTEILVFGRKAGISAADYIKNNDFASTDKDYYFKQVKRLGNFKRLNPSSEYNYQKIKTIVGKILAEHAGVLREDRSLKTGLDKLQEVKDVIIPNFKITKQSDLKNYFNIKNIVTVAEIIIRTACERKESRGVHYRLDYPKRDDRNWLKNIIVKENSGKFQLNLMKVKKGA